MKTISQRELRNDNAAVIRGVEQGETYIVTRRGVPVARLGPITDESDLRCISPATTRRTYARVPRVRLTESTAEILDAIRDDR